MPSTESGGAHGLSRSFRQDDAADDAADDRAQTNSSCKECYEPTFGIETTSSPAMIYAPVLLATEAAGVARVAAVFTDIVIASIIFYHEAMELASSRIELQELFNFITGVVMVAPIIVDFRNLLLV
ncbi:hypothetical protein AXG93_146s1350 [Marchantia polymorpha subsp. ruderalis]|uniref:Uncharacterized protein n=1 Tax=Marchantia polymorpha subsp. ruderalis TaxID=1480154 RepID=A0A176W7J0_MARPO|nr:hypothetical protein AXG93_146s1350 [Marchantia polymorpha subsp. ruderalis]